MMRNEGEQIIEIGAEGESIALYRCRTGEGWSFTMKVIDSTPAFIDEEHIQEKSDPVDSWDAALELLDRYPWPKLRPIFIHPDFNRQICKALQDRLSTTGPEVIHWREVCALDTHVRSSGMEPAEPGERREDGGNGTQAAKVSLQVSQRFFSRTGLPLFKPEDVIPYLGKQEKDFKPGRSAFETAYAWFKAGDGIPDSIRSVLKTNSIFHNASLEKAVFEKQTELDRYSGPSQTDVLAILHIPSGVAVLGIEAKVDEGFDKLVKDWRDGSESKEDRLAHLVRRLELDKLDQADVGQLRYQLLHRTVATLIEAKCHGATQAAMIVQSFSPTHAGFCDFQSFTIALGAPVAQRGELSAAIIRDGVSLRLGWAEDHVRSWASG